MMENHSYDNYLGMLSGRGEGFPLAADGQPDVSNEHGRRGDHPRVPAVLPGPASGVPSQSWHATHQQWGEGKCDGFVTSAQEVQAEARAGTAADPVDTAPEAATVGLSYWSERDLPFYYGLARTFPLADHWFSSCLGPTFPNRRFLIAGTAHGLIDDSPYNLLDYPPGRDHLRPADRARDLLGQLPPGGQRAAPVAALCPAHPQDGPAPPDAPRAAPCPP